MSPRLAPPATPGPRGAPRSKLRRRPPVPPGLRARVHRLPRHGRMLSAMVRCDPPGTDGVSDQEAAVGGRNALWEGSNLPAGKMCGQDPKEALLRKLESGIRFLRVATLCGLVYTHLNSICL